MKNILIISSSPRKKGNSQILCEQFKKGAEAKGHQVKIVRIMEQNIGFCRACDLYWLLRFIFMESVPR